MPYLLVFGLQRSYAEADEDAQIDIEWMPPTGCEYIKCADTGDNCERITASDMPWFSIAPGAMPLLDCTIMVLAEVLAVTSFSKPFCFQPGSYLGAVGDCWSGLSDNARHVIRCQSSHETRVLNVDDDMAWIIR